MRIVPPSATLEWITPDAALVIERAGRTCYKSEGAITDTSAATFLQKLKTLGHLSVFEHASASFRVVCDRGVSHEIVRHRLASYSQESTRYCNYGQEKHGGEISVVLPPDLRPCSNYVDHTDHDHCPACERFESWREAVATAEGEYLFLIKSGVAPQTARSVLPTCLKTELVWTANFREWLQVILPQRAQAPAHPQMVELVGGFIKPALVAACPEVFSL
jgi:thymidylate synthase (FAD)